MLKEVKYTFNIPQGRHNMHYYDSVIANNYDDALDLIRKKYPEAKVIEYSSSNTIRPGEVISNTGWEPSAFERHLWETIGPGW